MNFIDECIAGKASPDQIDEWISRWHDSPNGQDLHQFLGLVFEDYSRLLEDPSVIDSLILKYEFFRLINANEIPISVVASILSVSVQTIYQWDVSLVPPSALCSLKSFLEARK